MSALVDECERMLVSDGPFAAHVTDFRNRPQQETMVRHVVHAIESGEKLVVEAGTGVGKTFAYLLPAVLSGRRVIISTGTRYLQDQIYSRDLPLVLKALSSAADSVLLKGRANYLCLERLEQAWQARSLDSGDDGVVDQVYRWSKTDTDGDISGFEALSEDDSRWSLLTSTTENCLGAHCSKYDRCYVVAARSRAQQADIVVVNHYLLLADMNLKEEGFGQLLPEADTVIVDEAHQLGDIADRFFSTSFSSGQCAQFLREMRVSTETVKTPALVSVAAELEAAVKAMAKALMPLPERGAVGMALQNDAVAAAQRALSDNLQRFAQALESLKQQSDSLMNLWERAVELKRCFTTAFEVSGDYIGWYESGHGTFRFQSSPTDVAPLLSDKQALYKANWIYTSSTLSVDGDFTYFLRQVGLPPSSTCVAVGSPFNYAEQAALYIPKGLPEPGHPDHTSSVVEASYPLLEMMQDLARAGTFFLFTSHRALQAAAQKIADETRYTLLVQGAAPKFELIRRFYDTPHAVLLGTSGFWEGVDVRGAGLRCVIIDKLPFASPADPLTQGRIRKAKESGRDFFGESTLPEAVIALRQGIGRLIRDEHDRGVVVIGDTRLRTRGYGKVFLKSLPPMKRYSRVDALRPYLEAPP